MISINNLQKKFGEKLAVNIDHYEINQGDMLGLVGNNGAGKTTLFRIMLDLGMSSLTKLTSVKVKTGKTSQVLSLTMDF